MKVGHYIFNTKQLELNIQEINQAFSNCPNFNLAYSIKANYYDDLLKCCNKKGLHFDCASHEELQKLLKLNVHPSKIWINTPFLTEDLCRVCVELGVLINVDNIDQLELISETAKLLNQPAPLGIRINFQDCENSRFGIVGYSDGFQKAISRIEDDEYLVLLGLHTHYSGSDRSVISFSKRANKLFELYKHYWPNGGLKFLNVGGGIAGPMPHALKEQLNYTAPTWDEYSKSIEESWSKLVHRNQTKLIIEPGMALVANTFNFECEVINIKQVRDSLLATISASRTFLKPTGHQKELAFDIHHLSTESIQENFNYQLVGISCMESDILGQYTGRLNIGDKIIFKNVGAYTLSYSPDFIFTKAKVKSE